MKQLNLTTGKQKKALCRICSLSARLGRLRSICLGLISLGLISLGLISLSPVLSAATVDDLTFSLINEDKEYSVIDCANSATGSLTIPASYEGLPVTEIAYGAFRDSAITSISLPESITVIEGYAFYQSDLTGITLPAALIYLGDAAFAYCSKLSGSVTIPIGITELSSGIFYSTALEEVILHDAVTSIGYRAFLGTDITRITLPSSLKTIGQGAFRSTDLKSLSLPEGLTSIGRNAFYACIALSGTVTIPSGVTEIPDRLFNSCPALTEVILHDAITSIGEYAFSDSGINGITLPASLLSIGGNAFRNTPKLAEVRLEGFAPSLSDTVFADAGRDVAGGTRFVIYDTYQSSYENSAGWSNFAFSVLADPNPTLIEAFVLSTSMDASSTVFTIHSHGEPSNASALVLVQQSSSLSEGKWTAVDSADITVSRDSESGVVTRSFSLSPSAESGFYRLHYSASQSGQ